MRHLGIDYGTKKVGVALSDKAGVMGFPHATLPNDGKLMEILIDLIRREEVEAVVMGNPNDFGDANNSIGVAGREFARTLSEKAGIPVHMESEMFTTQAARRFPDGTRMAGSPDVDASAAALILTSYFSRTNPTNDDYDND